MSSSSIQCEEFVGISASKTVESYAVFQDFKKQMVVGTSSACIWITASHPFDTLKTRFQLDGTTGIRTTSLSQTCARMVRKEGIISFWRGLAFPLTTQALKGSFGWFGYNYFNRLFGNEKAKYESYSYVTSGFAGALAGLTVCGIVIPTEVLKIRMQGSQSRLLSGKTIRGVQYSNAIDLVSTMLRKEGIGSLWTGTTATYYRLTTAWFFYFSVQEALEDIMKGTKDPKVPPSDMVSLVAGGLAGIVSWSVSMPFDTLKTRMQMQPYKYSSFTDCVRRSFEKDGVYSFYKGFKPVICRAFVANALAFWSYRRCTKLYDSYQV